MPITKTLSQPGLLIGETGSLMVLVATRSPDNATYNLLSDQQEAFAKRVERASFMVVLPNFDGPLKADQETQKRRGESLSRLADRIAGQAMVMLVPGLKGTTLRLIITASTMVSGGKIPNKIFGTIDEGLAWLKELPGQTADLRGSVHLASEIAAFAATAK